VEFLNALIATDPAGPHPNAIEQFLGAHPAAMTFLQIPKPIPTSFAKESFFAVSAFKFTNAEGRSRYGRYRVLPVAGNEYLGEAGAAARSPDFLFDEIKERVAKEAVRFRVAVQLAEDGDTVDDAAVRWSEERPQLAFGEIGLDRIAPNNASEQQRIIFDPIPRVNGIEASADPLFEPRANVYLMSGRRRRAAGSNRSREDPFHPEQTSVDLVYRVLERCPRPTRAAPPSTCGGWTPAAASVRKPMRHRAREQLALENQAGCRAMDQQAPLAICDTSFCGADPAAPADHGALGLDRPRLRCDRPNK